MAFCLVLGSHINAFHILLSLHEKGIKEIALLDEDRSICFSSQIPQFKRHINRASWLDQLDQLQTHYKSLGVIYPTADYQLDFLYENFDAISSMNYFIPLNKETYQETSKKAVQYKKASSSQVSHPKTFSIYKFDHLEEALEKIQFPALLKPSKQYKEQQNDPRLFRHLFLDTENDYQQSKSRIASLISEDKEFLLSEVIPGDDNQIYAYTAYRSPKDSKILASWNGRKLSQYPNSYGVFSSACNESIDQLSTDGQKMLEALDTHGISEPEFKFDVRDHRLKLMEVNLRSMMWNGVGRLSGVNLPWVQFCDATERRENATQEIQQQKPVRLVYFAYELTNLLRRKNYLRTFLSNIFFHQSCCYWAIWSPKDPKVFLNSFFILFKRVLKVDSLTKTAKKETYK